MSNKKLEYAWRIVGGFALELFQSRSRQVEKMLPAAEIPPATGEALMRSGEVQKWLYMAHAALGLVERSEETAAYVRGICQALAQWLFAISGARACEVPKDWYDTSMGAMWAAALIWAEGDELVTIAEAAELSGVSIQAVSQRVDRGSLRSFTDPTVSNPRKGGRLVRRSDVERSLRPAGPVPR